jgi:hypothetical protein
MPRTKSTTPRSGALAVAALTALSLTVSACTGADTSEEAEPTLSAGPPSPSSPSPSESPTESPSPTVESTAPSETVSEEPSTPAASSPEEEPSTTVETTEDAPSASPVQPPPPGSGPREMLLAADELPGLNEQHRWQTVGTENRERREPVWACQVTDFLSIGATDVWVRRFVGRPGGEQSATARSAVITFVDNISARRAYAVLQGWHERCEDRLSEDYRRVQVASSATAVEVQGAGQAEWRMAIYGPVPGDRDAGYFDATGYVREGNRISLTTMVSVGQDYNYPAGEEPIVGAVRSSAVKLRR